MSLQDLLKNTTPGPWRYRESDGWVLDAADYFVVRQAGRNPEVVASARLIALAPDAVALLIDMAAQFQRLVDAYDGEGWDTVQALLARFAALNEKAGT